MTSTRTSQQVDPNESDAILSNLRILCLFFDLTDPRAQVSACA